MPAKIRGKTSVRLDDKTFTEIVMSASKGQMTARPDDNPRVQVWLDSRHAVACIRPRDLRRLMNPFTPELRTTGFTAWFFLPDGMLGDATEKLGDVAFAVLRAICLAALEQHSFNVTTDTPRGGNAWVHPCVVCNNYIIPALNILIHWPHLQRLVDATPSWLESAAKPPAPC